MKHSLFQKTLVAVAITQCGVAWASNPVSDFFEGDASGSFRLRMETVDVDLPSPVVLNKDEATALTLRTRLAYATKETSGFSANIEFEDVRNVMGVNEYAPYDTDYAIIADQPVTELNEAYIKYKADGLTFKGGRQRIVLDNHRFVGHVGWRQDDQTFDAYHLNYVAGDFDVTGAIIEQVNGINNSAFDAYHETYLLNAGYKTPFGKLTGYMYNIDNADADAQWDTTGLRFAGKTGEDIKFSYAIEMAQQDITTPASTEFEADYMLIELGATFSGISVTVAQETLGSDDGMSGFQTPLATKHKFQGWADQFLGTPAQGIVDSYVSVGGKVGGVKLLAIMHDYEADESTATVDDLGDEINLLAVKKFSNGVTVGGKYASYGAGDIKNDVDKIWIWTEVAF